MSIEIISPLFVYIIFLVFSLYYEGRVPIYSGVIKIIRIGITIFFIIILFFSALFFLTSCIVVSGSGNQASFADCQYFSLITFATIGYGDILPACQNAKNVIFFETIISLIFIPLFGGFIFNEILNNRPQNIFLPKSIIVLLSLEQKFLFEIENRGGPTVANKIIIEVGKAPYSFDTALKSNLYTLDESPYFEIYDTKTKDYLEKKWSVIIAYDFNNNKNVNLLKEYFNRKNNKFEPYEIPFNYQIKVTFNGYDLKSSKFMYSSKIYTFDDFIEWS